MPVPRNHKRRKVEMIDMAGNVIDEFDSESHAARSCYMHSDTVSDRCRGIVKNPFRNCDFTFRFKEEP